MAETRFDRTYYDRFYENPGTRVVNAGDIARLGDFVCSYLTHLGQPVRAVLDIGCGLGWWRPVIARHFPKARYCGVEVSEYLCDEFGWQRGSVVDYPSKRAFDLVICQGVVQYLGHSDAKQAIQNLARLCRGTLYLEVLTLEDWRQNCDRRRTDGRVHLRTGDWYRRNLREHFVNCGGGVFASRRSGIVSYELETLS